MRDGAGEEGRNCLHKSVSNRWGRENEAIKTVRGSGFASGKGCQNSFNFLEEDRKLRASLVVHLVKNPLAMQETPVQFLGWEDPLEKGEAAHSSILARRIPWTV